VPQQASITLLDARARALAGEDTLLYRYAPLAAHALAPRAALTSGGGVLTVAGAGFAPPGARPCEARCRFGGSTEVPAVVASPRELRCVIPPLPTPELDAAGPPPSY
jgi:hypothetical protein